MIKNTIKDDVAETLYIPLYMKCKETQRKAPFFQDPFACDIVSRIEYDFQKYDKALLSTVGVAIRAGFFDQLTEQFIKTHSEPVVVHIGCGLDTRFMRLGKEVTDKAIVYELDLPEVITLRNKFLTESRNHIHIPASMFGSGWMRSLKKKHSGSSFLFVIEGVLMYFEKNKIEDFFVNLTENFDNSEIVFDVVSGWIRKNSHRHDSIKYTRSQFKFGCDDDREMESWSPHLKYKFSKVFSDFSEWKKTGFFVNLCTKFFPVIRNSGRMLCYRIE